MSEPTRTETHRIDTTDHIHSEQDTLATWVTTWDGATCPDNFACTLYPRVYDLSYYVQVGEPEPGVAPRRLAGSSFVQTPADDVARGMFQAESAMVFASLTIEDMDPQPTAILRMIEEAQARLRYAMTAAGPLLYPDRWATVMGYTNDAAADEDADVNLDDK